MTPGLKQRTPELCPHQGVAAKQFRVTGAVVPTCKVPRETAHCGTPFPPCLGGSFTCAVKGGEGERRLTTEL